MNALTSTYLTLAKFPPEEAKTVVKAMLSEMILKGKLGEEIWVNLFQLDVGLFQELLPSTWNPPLHLWQDLITTCVLKKDQPDHVSFKSLQFLLDHYPFPWAHPANKIEALGSLHRLGLNHVKLASGEAALACAASVDLLEWLATENHELYLSIARNHLQTPIEAGFVLQSKFLISCTPVDVLLMLLKSTNHESRLKADYETFFTKVLSAGTGTIFSNSAVLPWISGPSHLTAYNVEAIKWLAVKYHPEYLVWFKGNLAISEQFSMVDAHWDTISQTPALWPAITADMETKAYGRVRARSCLNKAGYPWKIFSTILSEDQKHAFALAFIQNPFNASTTSAFNVISTLAVFHPNGCPIDINVPWSILELLLSKITKPAQHTSFIATILTGDRAQYMPLLALDIADQIRKASPQLLQGIDRFKGIHPNNLTAVIERSVELGITSVLLEAAKHHKGLSLDLLAEVVMLDSDRFKTRHLSASEVEILHKMAKMADRPNALAVLKKKLHHYTKPKATPTTIKTS